MCGGGRGSGSVSAMGNRRAQHNPRHRHPEPTPQCKPLTFAAAQPSSRSAATSRSVAAASRSVMRTCRSSPQRSPGATRSGGRRRWAAIAAPSWVSERQPHERRRRSAGTTATCRASARASRSRSRAAAARRRASDRVAELERPRGGGLRGRVDAERRRQPLGQLGGRREHVADAEARHRVRLGERAEHEQVGQLGDERGGVLAGLEEVGERLVEQHPHALAARARTARARPRARRRAPVGSFGLRERDAPRVAGSDRARASSASAGPAPATGRPPASCTRSGSGRQPGHATSSSPPLASSCAQAARSSSPAPWPTATCSGRTPWRAAATRAPRWPPGRGRRSCARRSANVAALTASGCGGSCHAVRARSSSGTKTTSRARSSSRRSRSSRETSSGGSSSNCR